MACKGCGGQATAPAQPCRTFTFPLGLSGEVDIVFRGTPTADDIRKHFEPMANFVGHTMGQLAAQAGDWKAEANPNG